MRIDLHTHSLASDGTQTPTDLITEAAAVGLDVVAITDHDTTDGWDEAAHAARREGIALVRGIEISCLHEGISVHLLGYLHDPHDPTLVSALAAARDSRDSRARRIVENLARDLPITWDDVRARSTNALTIGRPHIADALVGLGVVASREEAFDRYLHSGSPYYARYEAITPLEAVRLVRAAGGVPVMAHPYAARRGRVVDEEVIAALVDAGLFALEAHHPEHTPEQVDTTLAVARNLHVPVTGSSDYHGAGKTNRLGQCTTDPEVFAALLDQASATPLVVP